MGVLGGIRESMNVKSLAQSECSINVSCSYQERRKVTQRDSSRDFWSQITPARTDFGLYHADKGHHLRF